MNRQEFVRQEFRKRNIDLLENLEQEQEQEDVLSIRLDRSDWDEDMRRELEELYRKKSEKDKKKMAVPFRRWVFPRDRKALEAKFREQYRCFVHGCKNAKGRYVSIDDMLDLLSQLNTYVIFARISKQRVYILGDEEDITQEGHIAVAALLEEDCRLKTERPGCLEYYTGIYRNKTMDYLEFYGLLKKKKDKQQDPDTPQKDEQSGKITKSSIRAAQSMEGMIGEDEDADRRLELSEDPFSLYGYSQESRRILMVYLQELLAYDKAPGAALAVMYARVLYQLERLLDADCIERMAQAYMKQKKWSTDPEHKAYQRHLAKATAEIQKYTTATSPIWAMERIGRQTLGQMKVDSEVSLQVNFDAGLAWGEAFVSKLSEPAQIGGMVPWSDVVYLDYYSKEQIENWATDIHNSMAFKTAGIIVQDQALKQFVLDELGNKGRLKKALRDRMQQLQKKEVKRK